MQRNLLRGGAAALVAMILIALAVHGTGEKGLLAVISATARASAVCLALVLARVRPREFSVLLLLSHGLHYAFIVIGGLWQGAVAITVGAVVYALMMWNALRPNAVALYLVWFAFLAAIRENLHGTPWYAILTGLLVVAMAVRWGRALLPHVARLTTRSTKLHVP